MKSTHHVKSNNKLHILYH